MALRLVAAFWLGLTATAAAAAEDLPVPSGEIILTISGEISNTNNGEVAEFDFDMLAELGDTKFETSTIWTEGTQIFEGVSLRRLLDVVGADGQNLTISALNDYSIDMPVSEARQVGPILAISRNAQPMAIRDKGPIWLVYPYDSDAKFRTKVIYSRSVWQLDRIAVNK